MLDVEVEGANGGRLGRPVAKAFEEHIRNWRFEPITQDGMPVNVVGHMKLSLVATRVRGEKEAVFGIRKVWFLDPPKTRAGSPGASPAHRMPAPSYPKEPMSEGVGAEVMLALKLGPDGRATEVATQSLSLLGNISSQENIRRRHARVLRHSAENAGKRWTFEGFADGEVVLVPVRYHPGFDSAWLHTVALNVDVPLWVLARMADETAVRFDGGGQPLSTQIKLDTPLVDPITPAAGG